MFVVTCVRRLISTIFEKRGCLGTPQNQFVIEIARLCSITAAWTFDLISAMHVRYHFLQMPDIVVFEFLKNNCDFTLFFFSPQTPEFFCKFPSYNAARCGMQNICVFISGKYLENVDTHTGNPEIIHVEQPGICLKFSVHQQPSAYPPAAFEFQKWTFLHTYFSFFFFSPFRFFPFFPFFPPVPKPPPPHVFFILNN